MLALLSGKRIDAWRQYPHMDAAFVQFEPAAFDGKLGRNRTRYPWP